MDFACPKCKGALFAVPGGNTKKCLMGHSYDKARAGYYNYLLGASGGVHGDNAEMVEARREFLSLDYYKPLAMRMSELVLEGTPREGCVLDAGCGEGYYTDFVERALIKRDGQSNVLAFDISRDAVKLAHKRNGNVSFAVATAYDMPLASESVDTVYNAFSPLARDEVVRVLKRGGRFIMAYPAEDHLWGLKCAIYKTPYKNKPEGADMDGFKTVSTERLSYKMTLGSPREIRALFMMTPYAYRTPREDRGRVLGMESIITEADFYISVYEKI